MTRRATEITFRRLTPADAADYRRLRLYGLREYPKAFGTSYEEESALSLDALAARVAETAGKWTLGAFRGKRLVGLVTVIRDTQLKTRHRAAIYGVYVSPACRGEGVGRGLLTRAIADVRALEGVRQVRLSVGSTNRTAFRLYASLGFVKYGEEPQALFIEGRFYDETLMVLQFSRHQRTSVAKKKG